MSELSDELLVAYVDGQLAKAQSVAVKRVVDFDEVAAQRVVGLRNANKRLEEAFADMLRDKPEQGAADDEAVGGEAPPPAAGVPGETALAVFLGDHGRLVVAAAAAALMTLGAGAGYFFAGGLSGPAGRAAPRTAAGVPDWQREIARTQALFGREALEVSLESQANRDLVRFQLANAIGAAIVVPDLGDLGFRFVRAQLLRRAGAPIAQISYLPDQGAPIALYATAFDQHGPPPGAHAEDGVQTRAWVHGGIAYVLAAGLGAAETTRLAEAVKQRVMAP